MNTQERYNKTIGLIERLAEESNSSAREIGIAAANLNGLQFRDMSTIFGYLMDTTLYSYIMSRKIVAAYKHLINSDRKDISTAVQISGYSDQPSFTKAFKKQFRMTPMEAFKIKDSSRITPPLTWDILSGDTASPIFQMEKAEMTEHTFFGVSETKYNKMAKALELEAFYGFPHFCAEYAFLLSEEKEYSLEDAFGYVASTLEYYDKEYYDDFYDTIEPITEEVLRKIGDDEDQQSIYFKHNISVVFIRELLDKIHAKPYEILNCDTEIFKLYPGFEGDRRLSFSKYLKAVEFFEQYADAIICEEGFNNYLTEVLEGYPLEIAFASVYYSLFNELDEYDYSYDRLFEYDPDKEREKIERKYGYLEWWEAERWGMRERLDGDLYYDPDNPEYDNMPDDDW